MTRQVDDKRRPRALRIPRQLVDENFRTRIFWCRPFDSSRVEIDDQYCGTSGSRNWVRLL